MSTVTISSIAKLKSILEDDESDIDLKIPSGVSYDDANEAQTLLDELLKSGRLKSIEYGSLSLPNPTTPDLLPVLINALSHVENPEENIYLLRSVSIDFHEDRDYVNDEVLELFRRLEQSSIENIELLNFMPKLLEQMRALLDLLVVSESNINLTFAEILSRRDYLDLVASRIPEFKVCYNFINFMLGIRNNDRDFVRDLNLARYFHNVKNFCIFHAPLNLKSVPKGEGRGRWEYYIFETTGCRFCVRSPMHARSI